MRPTKVVQRVLLGLLITGLAGYPSVLLSRRACEDRVATSVAERIGDRDDRPAIYLDNKLPMKGTA